MHQEDTAARNFAKALLLPINPAAIVILGLYTLSWGLWVANPFWEVFTRAPLYHVLATIPPSIGFVHPELFWGAIAIVAGLVIIYGALRRSYRALIFGAGTAMWHWAMIATLYFMGDWQNTGGLTALAFAIYGAFIYLNIRVNYKDRHKSYGFVER